MKTFKLIGAMLLALTLLVSCGGGDDPVTPDKPVVPEKPDKPKEPSITLPSGEDDYFSKGMNFDTNAGEKSFSFQTDADWTISVASTRSGESWCSISPTSGKAGKHTVKVKTEANTTYDNRRVTLTLAAGTTKKTIAITQKQQDALTLTKDKFEVDAKGGTIEVEVKANISYDVIIPETSKGWISKSTKSRGLTASTLVFEIAESEESEKREGEIIIKSGEITETIHVYQSGQKILLLSQNEFNITAEGDTIKVELRSNVDFGVKMPEVDWISELKGSRAASSHTLYYIIKANETYNQRDANIVFFDQDSDIAETLEIIQSQKDALLIGQKDFSVGSEGESIEVKVSSNIEYDIDINCDWITKVESRGLVEKNLIFNIKSNKSKEARIGKIFFNNKERELKDTIIVNQLAEAPLKKITSITEISPYYNTKTTYVYLYDDKGRLSVVKDNYSVTKYTWSETTISIETSGRKSLVLLNDGKINSCINSKNNSYYFNYNTLGQLSSITDKIQNTFTLNWEDDNLTSVIETYDNNKYTDVIKYDKTIKYANSFHFIDWDILEFEKVREFAPLLSAHPDLLGNYNKNAIVEYGDSEHHRFTYDKKEYPEKIIDNWKDGPQTGTTTYLITWN